MRTPFVVPPRGGGPSTTASSAVDVLIVGAGQAGLAIGQHLRSSGLSLVLVDRNPRIGDSWRARYDSLTLFTPRAYSALPGLVFRGPPDGYPTKDEMADYLELYATVFGLPVRLGVTVDHLNKGDDGFVASLSNGDVIRARSVVIATGGFATQRIPALTSGFAPAVRQLASSSYRSASDVPAGTVLVVGDGAAGRQIAAELATTRTVLLAAGGSPHPIVRDRLLGRSLFWWLDRTGLLNASRTSRIGRRMMAKDSIPRPDLDLRILARKGVSIRSRLIAASGSLAIFDSGMSAAVDAVIWATGYRNRTDWVHVAGALDGSGDYVHERGVSPVDGLFLIGQPWQWSRGSATVGGVARDAAFIGAQLRASVVPEGPPTGPAWRRAFASRPIGVPASIASATD
jgi:putative flavoprotein involved in K+ transport